MTRVLAADFSDGLTIARKVRKSHRHVEQVYAKQCGCAVAILPGAGNMFPRSDMCTEPFHLKAKSSSDQYFIWLPMGLPLRGVRTCRV